MTTRMRQAIAAMRAYHPRVPNPAEPDGAVSSETWLAERPPFVHWRTAEALERAGLVRIDNYWPDGADIYLIEAEGPVAADPSNADAPTPSRRTEESDAWPP